jgi:hypothetical protein
MPLLIISPIPWIDRSRSAPILGAFPRPTFKAPLVLSRAGSTSIAHRLNHLGALSVSSVLELPLCLRYSGTLSECWSVWAPLEDPCLSAVIVVDVIGESEFEQTQLFSLHSTAAELLELAERLDQQAKEFESQNHAAEKVA